MLQGIQLGRPEAFDAREPLIQFGKAGRVDAVDAALRVDAHRHQLGLAQHFQMLRDGRRAEVEMLGDLPSGEFPSAEDLDDLAAGGVGKCGEGEQAVIIAQMLK